MIPSGLPGVGKSTVDPQSGELRSVERANPNSPTHKDSRTVEVLRSDGQNNGKAQTSKRVNMILKQSKFNHALSVPTRLERLSKIKPQGGSGRPPCMGPVEEESAVPVSAAF